jgi:hypothetical protein
MIEALDRMELSKYFKAIVTDEDDMESIAHRFLSAAMKACFCSASKYLAVFRIYCSHVCQTCLFSPAGSEALKVCGV